MPQSKSENHQKYSHRRESAQVIGDLSRAFGVMYNHIHRGEINHAVYKAAAGYFDAVAAEAINDFGYTMADIATLIVYWSNTRSMHNA